MSILKRFYRVVCATAKRSSRQHANARTVVRRHHTLYYYHMEKQTVSFRLETNKVAALDALAGSMDRDRTYLLSEAVQAYLDLQQWHIEQIEAGIAEADAGQVVDHRRVKAMAARWRRPR